MTKEKKEYIVLGILVLAIIGAIYFYMRPSAPAAPANTQTANNSQNPQQSQNSTSPTDALQTLVNGPFLPNGTTLNINLLNDPRYQTLIDPVYPQVDRSEVGNPNPFNNLYLPNR